MSVTQISLAVYFVFSLMFAAALVKDIGREQGQITLGCVLLLLLLAMFWPLFLIVVAVDRVGTFVERTLDVVLWRRK